MSTDTTTAGMVNRHSLLTRTVQSIAATNSQYSVLFRPAIVTHPILYFGNPTSARFATFGVNPSADEFGGGRWPVTLTVNQLELHKY